VLVDVTVTALYDDVVVPYVDEVYTTTTKLPVVALYVTVTTYTY